MKKCIITICLSFLLISGMAGSVYAYSAQVGFFFDGIDLDTGAVEYDRTTLVILMGETIEELLRPDRKYLAEFSPSVDASFEFDPGEPDLFELVLQDDVKIAILEDTSFDTIESIMPGEFEFTGEPYSVSISSDDLVVAWTAEDRYFKLGGFQWSDWLVQLDIEELNVVPEPSTLLLLGLGLIGVVGLIRRKKNIVAMFAIIVLASLWGAEIINAQPASLITVGKEGPGNGSILVGDQKCDPACLEMSVPYVEHRSIILKVIPDEDSYFVRWKMADGSSSEGALSVQPGDTVIAVFGKKWVPFDPVAPADLPTPPEIQVPVSTLQEVVVDVDFPGMHVGLIEEEGKIYQHLTMSDTGHIAKVGKPQLPMFGRFIALPAGANVNVEVLEASFQELEEYTIYPAQEPPQDNKDAPIPPFTIDADVYEQDAFYPSNLFEVENPSIIRGTLVVILRMFPVQFNPVQRTLRVYSNLRVRLSFDGGEGYFIDDELRSSSFDSILGNLLLNAGTAISSGLPSDAASNDNNSLLIITHPDFLDAAKKLAEWKIQKGIETTIATADDDTTNWEKKITGWDGSILPQNASDEDIQKHREIASVIKKYIEEAYKGKMKPTYVLLIGDAEFISCHYKTSTIGTDLYYATVDGDDYIPDIHIGRLSVDTLSQANKRVNDIIAYEKKPPSDPNFYTHASLAAYFQDNNKDGYEDRRYVHTTEDIRDYLKDSGYTIDRIYSAKEDVEPANWSNISHYWPGMGAAIPDELKKPAFEWNGGTAEIRRAVNEGRFLIIHRDHGDRFWGWYEPGYTTNDVGDLTNGNELPVVWSINCQTGWFDNETDDPIAGTLSTTVHFSEAWERNDAGGAIGIIAATRNSPSAPNDRLAWGWMDAIWPNFNASYPSSTSSGNPIFEMGAVLNQGKLYFNSLDNYSESLIKREFELFHWFGDPTMQIQTEAPQMLIVSHPSTLSEGATSIDVTVDQADALICISKDGKILGKSLSSGGMTTISWSTPLTAGDVIHITVTKHNYWPYEGTAQATGFHMERFKITAADRAADDQFGKSVAISGDYAIVGARYDDDRGESSGSAYIFKRDERNSWTQQAKLTAADGAAGDLFGWSVSISGEYVIVGARWDDDRGVSSGSAYIFKRDGNSWIQQAKLTVADGAEYANFGSSVAISGEYVIVGSHYSTSIFKQDGASWTQQTKLSQGAASVSISGEYAIVGNVRWWDLLHPHDNDSVGSAFIFKREGANWAQQVGLSTDGEIEYDEFGYSVSISGEYAIVGEPDDNANGGSGWDSGAAYIYTLPSLL